MLFEVSNQFWISISFIWLGMLVGGVSEFLLIKTNKKWLKILNSFLFWIATGFIFFLWVTKFGETIIRFYYIILLIIGFILEKIFWYKTIANYKKMIYNKLNRLFVGYKLKLKNLLQQKKIHRIKKLKEIKRKGGKQYDREQT